MNIQYIWVIVIIMCLGIEALTLNLVTIWMALGALVALLFSFFIDNAIIQVLIFIITTLLTLFFTRRFVMDVLKVKEVKTNLDSVVGQVGLVVSDISEDKSGRITVAGKSWAAVSTCNISVGERVDILAIEGVKLVVKRRDE